MIANDGSSPMEQVIIGVHGLGNKPPKAILEEWWRLALYEGLHRINHKGKIPKFEMVYWADVMYDSPLDTTGEDPKSPYFLREPYQKAQKEFPLIDKGLRIMINNFITNQLKRIFLNDDYSLNYKSIATRLVREYLRDFDVYFKKECSPENSHECLAKQIINDRLKNALHKYKDHEIILVGHSMGAVIAFDVLNFEMPAQSVHTYITIGAPLGLPLVLNKVGIEQKLRPGDDRIMNAPESIIRHWFNFSDLLDLVSFNFRLNDDFTASSYGVMVEDFIINNDYEVNGKRNPHKSFGYLRAKEFSKTLKKLIDAGNVSEGSSLSDIGKKLAKEVWDNLKKPLRMAK